jgi:peptidoglycan/LPS O-acetylase OafA/YrhL
MGVITASRNAIRSDNADDMADQTRSTALAQITMYIPSDVLAIYVAVLGVMTPSSDRTKWTVFAIGAALCVCVPFLSLWAAVRSSPGQPHPRWAKQAAVALLAVIAFTAYAMAVPDTVFLTTWLRDDANRIGAASALVLSLLLPLLASGLRITPQDKRYGAN